MSGTQQFVTHALVTGGSQRTPAAFRRASSYRAASSRPIHSSCGTLNWMGTSRAAAKRRKPRKRLLIGGVVRGGWATNWNKKDVGGDDEKTQLDAMLSLLRLHHSGIAIKTQRDTSWRSCGMSFADRRRGGRGGTGKGSGVELQFHKGNRLSGRRCPVLLLLLPLLQLTMMSLN